MDRIKEEGNLAFSEKRYEEAESIYSKGILQDPKHHILYGNRSATRFHLKKYEESLQDAEKANAIDPTWAKGYFRQGSALEALNMYRKAQKAYAKAVSFDSKNKEVQNKINTVKKKADQLDRTVPIAARLQWKDVYQNISDAKLKLGVLVLLWNLSSQKERFSVFLRLLGILAGHGQPVKHSTYRMEQMQEIPSLLYDALTLPENWVKYYTSLTLPDKVNMFEDMYVSCTESEKTTIVNDMKAFMELPVKGKTTTPKVDEDIEV